MPKVRCESEPRAYFWKDVPRRCTHRYICMYIFCNRTFISLTIIVYQVLIIHVPILPTGKVVTCSACFVEGHTKASNVCSKKVIKCTACFAEGHTITSSDCPKYEAKVLKCTACFAEGHTKASKKCPNYVQPIGIFTLLVSCC